MNPLHFQRAASASLLALIVLCVLWEGWLAPIRPGGSWLTLKALPLLAPLFGILRGKRYTYQWTSMLSLLYVAEGVLRIGDPGLMGVFAALELALSMVLFFATMFYARFTAPSRSRPDGE
ncbi:DUF2069 domain-containing protein [Pseudothauera nasutitermitis]|uniref:DUF2069 domain-containing protein n=1 Tax=Pseudothauera nasutitermitis TaxID=2565930 RepID=A0A4S4ASL2_9RHOO|nr:DUF2069 domain-containing protein [Pseudothauera nasutitermitis]THF61504.1 DUF2069 domain-containing protein [Pseudothauera nasutitermitis]